VFLSLRRSIRNTLRIRYAINFAAAVQGQYREQFAYGHREVLLDYAEMSRDLIFKAVIPHGKIAPHALDPILAHFDLSNDQALPQLLWRDDSNTEALKAGVEGVRSIGAPFLYALANSGQTIKKTKENLNSLASNTIWKTDDQEEILNSFDKILYMPIHSWEGDVVNHFIPIDSLLRKVDPMRVVVCLGFLDFCNPNVRKVYEDCGWKLTCAGVRDSMILNSPAGGREKFLYSLANIFSEADIVIANEFTTGLFYAASLGKPIAIIQGLTENKLTYSSWNSNETFQNVLNLQQATFPWLYGGACTPGQILKDLENALGVNSFKEPAFFQKEVETLRIDVANTALH
jgi:hypothetical protein